MIAKKRASQQELEEIDAQSDRSFDPTQGHRKSYKKPSDDKQTIVLEYGEICAQNNQRNSSINKEAAESDNTENGDLSLVPQYSRTTSAL